MLFGGATLEKDNLKIQNRGCAATFCFLDEVEAPGIQAILASNEDGLFWSQPDSKKALSLSIPGANFMLQDTAYWIMFSQRGGGYAVVKADTLASPSSSSLTFRAPVWNGQPGFIDVNLAGPTPTFMGCTEVDSLYSGSTLNVRVNYHERFTDKGAAARNSTPFDQCWDACTKLPTSSTDGSSDFFHDESVVKFSKNIVEEGVAGSWGGQCACPDGNSYNVGTLEGDNSWVGCFPADGMTVDASTVLASTTANFNMACREYCVAFEYFSLRAGRYCYCMNARRLESFKHLRYSSAAEEIRKCDDYRVQAYFYGKRSGSLDSHAVFKRILAPRLACIGGVGLGAEASTIQATDSAVQDPRITIEIGSETSSHTKMVLTASKNLRCPPEVNETLNGEDMTFRVFVEEKTKVGVERLDKKLPWGNAHLRIQCEGKLASQPIRHNDHPGNSLEECDPATVGCRKWQPGVGRKVTCGRPLPPLDTLTCRTKMCAANGGNMGEKGGCSPYYNRTVVEGNGEKVTTVPYLGCLKSFGTNDKWTRLSTDTSEEHHCSVSSKTKESVCCESYVRNMFGTRKCSSVQPPCLVAEDRFTNGFGTNMACDGNVVTNEWHPDPEENKDFETTVSIGIDPTAVPGTHGACMCAFGDVKTSISIFSDPKQANCQKKNPTNSVLEVYTALPRWISVKVPDQEGFEFVWQDPLPPSIPAAERPSSSQITVTWQMPLDLSNVPVRKTRVVIHFSKESGGVCDSLPVNESASDSGGSWMTTEGDEFCVAGSRTVTGLEPSTSYCFRICCEAIAAGSSALFGKVCPSNNWVAVEGRTLPPDPPDKPASVETSVVLFDSVTLEWNPPPQSVNPVDEYVVFYGIKKMDECETNYDANFTVEGGNATSTVINGLQEDTSYNIGVAAVNLGGVGSLRESNVRTASLSTVVYICPATSDGSSPCEKDGPRLRQEGMIVEETLQKGLANTTRRGQKVMIFPGTYPLEDGPLWFRSHAVQLLGVELDPTKQIIDCNGRRCFEDVHSCVEESKGVRLPNHHMFASQIGFVTLRNGSAPAGGYGGLVQLQMTPSITYLTHFRHTIFKGGRAWNGGCLSVRARSVLVDDSTFENCVASNAGGALAVYGASKVSVKSTYFRDNVAGRHLLQDSLGNWSLAKCKWFRGNPLSPGGGAIAVNKDWRAPPSSISNEKVCPSSSQGGGIPTLRFRDTKFDRNVAQCGSGGAVLIESVEILGMKKLNQFINNSALDGSGGAISILQSKFIAQDDQGRTVFEGNYAAKHGGALELNLAQATIRRAHFQHNQAMAQGGAVFAEGSLTKVNIGGSQYLANSAGRGGG